MDTANSESSSSFRGGRGGGGGGSECVPNLKCISSSLARVSDSKSRNNYAALLIWGRYLLLCVLYIGVFCVCFFFSFLSFFFSSNLSSVSRHERAIDFLWS